MSLLPPIQKERVITQLPGGFKREAVLHRKDDFNSQVKQACEKQRARSEDFKLSKVILVGDLAVGKTCLINRSCKGVFNKNYKETIGVDFEMEGVGCSLHPAAVGHLRTGAVQMHRLHLLQRSPGSDHRL